MEKQGNQTGGNKTTMVPNAVPEKLESNAATFQFRDRRQTSANNGSLKSKIRQGATRNKIAQLKSMVDGRPLPPSPIQKKSNKTGLPDQLKTGLESMSGHSMDDVKVHFNSDKPAQLQALAYAQGTNIHLGPGQEKHLPHEAWHVVQQKQGRVQATTQFKGLSGNDNPSLEKEADIMGAKAASLVQSKENTKEPIAIKAAAPIQRKPVIQRLAGMEIELRIPFYGDTHGVATDNTTFLTASGRALNAGQRRAVINFLYGGLQYGHQYGAVAGQYDISADHTAWLLSHYALRNHLEGNQLANPVGPYPSMTNMEYRTEALEERGAGSDATMATISTAVKNHAVASAALATGGRSAHLGAPVAGEFTGIPVIALRQLLFGDQAGLALFQTMKDTLDPSLYFQTTVGALPSEIPNLFEEAATDIDNKIPNNPKAALLRYSVIRARVAINHGNNAVLVGGFTAGNKKSLLGWMTLLAQYLLAYQLETTNLRYNTNAHGHRVKRGGTDKNLVPYLSKTNLVATIAALPAAVRPDLVGATRAEWIELFRVLYLSCRPNAINLVNVLGLHDYNGQNYYDANDVLAGVIAHNGIFADAPNVWISNLIQALPQGNHHIQTGNHLTLDGGQENQLPEQNIPGEQAIPLEDRASQYKASFGDKRDIAHLDDTMNATYARAKNRRIASTADRTTYTTAYATLGADFASFGTLRTRVPALNALHLRYAALPANPDELAPSTQTIATLRVDFLIWKAANSDDSLALGLLAPLIGKANWSSKGFRLFQDNVIPSGVVELQAELATGHNAATKIANLAAIGLRKLGGGGRKQVTTNMYTLVRDTPGWVGNAAGWTNFVTLYNTTNGAV